MKINTPYIINDIRKIKIPNVILTNIFNFIKQNISTILILGLLIYISVRPSNKTIVIQSDKKIDSLNFVIARNNEVIKSKEKIIDSLNNTKTKTSIYYETIIKDFSNTAIVSDDSITKYISGKIYNK